MKKMAVLGAVCFSATILLAQTQKNKHDEAPPPVKASTAKFMPLNVKTGLWQSTSSITISGSLGLPADVVAKLTPEQRAKYEAATQAQGNGRSRTYTNKGCLTREDLTKDPFEKTDSGEENIHCHGTLLSSTSTDIVVQETCSGDATMNYTMKIHAVDQEHAAGTGQGTGTMGGKTMNSIVKWDSKWLGATCPAGANQE